MTKKKQTKVVSMKPEIMDVKCEIKGCKNGGAMPDHDGVNKCQDHLAESAFKNRVSKMGVTKTTGRNSPCVCGSGVKYKKCCGNLANIHLQWFVKNIGRRVWFKTLPPCPQPDCENCRKVKLGIFIEDHRHARKMFLYSEQQQLQCTTEKPNYK